MTYQLACKRMLSHDDAQDSARNAVLTALEDALQAGGDLNSTDRAQIILSEEEILRCASNAARNAQRACNRHYTRHAELSDEVVHNLSLASTSPVDAQVFAREDQRILIGALKRLQPESRRLFLAHHYYGCSLADLSMYTGRTEGAVKQLLSWIRGRLRFLMELLGWESPERQSRVKNRA